MALLMKKEEAIVGLHNLLLTSAQQVNCKE